MSSYGPAVALRLGNDSEPLARAHAALYREAQRVPSRRSSPCGSVELALRASNALVWIYAGLQLTNCI
jgi:hypothetical protein